MTRQPVRFSSTVRCSKDPSSLDDLEDPPLAISSASSLWIRSPMNSMLPSVTSPVLMLEKAGDGLEGCALSRSVGAE